MTSRILPWFAFVACLICVGLHAATPGIQRAESTEYYDVSGATIAELLAQLNAHGPTAGDGTRVFGYTDWHLSWNYGVEQHAEKFKLTSVTVNVRIVYWLPRRVGSNRLDGVAGSWSRFLTALTMHERGHGSNAVMHAEKLMERLLAPREFSSRAELETFVKTEGDRALADARKGDIDYDQRTKHGFTQGAVLRQG